MSNFISIPETENRTLLSAIHAFLEEKGLVNAAAAVLKEGLQNEEVSYHGPSLEQIFETKIILQQKSPRY